MILFINANILIKRGNEMKKLTLTIAVFTVLVMASSAYSAAPANDMFTDSIAISGASGSVTGSNVDATIEIGEPPPRSNKTVWWSWTAPASGGCEFNTYGSDFDTYLAVFTGSSVGALTLVAENDDSDSGVDSKVCFDVTAGQTYQIQVSGHYSYDVGEIILNWQLGGSLSGWFLGSSDTDTYFNVRLAYDLSALSYKYTTINNDYFQTNDLGCKMWKYETLTIFPDGFSITDKKKSEKVENKPLEGIGNQAYVKDYNGKQILVYDEDSKKLTVYAVKKDSFVKLGEQTLDKFHYTWFADSEIYVETRDKSSYPTKYGIQVFDNKLKKEKWSYAATEGNIEVVGKDLIAHRIWTGENLKITCIKNGKKRVSEHSLTEPSGYNLYYEIDKKGGILYWTKKSNTKSPLTYLDRKGKKIVDNLSLTGVGNTWLFENFDGKALYVSKRISSSNYVFYAYKLKGMKKLGQQNIDIPQSGSFSITVNKKVYVFPLYNDSGWICAAHIFDKKLKKEQWKEDYAEGLIEKIGKDTLVRITYSTSGDTVTSFYKLFNKKGEIVTYTFEYVD